MKTHQATSPRLQPLTPADHAYIRALAAEHSVGLEQRCARYRRRASIRRYTVAVCLFLSCCTFHSSVMAAPLYEQVTTSSEAGNLYICDIIRLSIENVS